MLTHEFSHTARIAAKIRTLRRSKEYSQEYMALMLHISQNAYSRLENGKTPITVDRLFEICNILNANAAALVEKEEAPLVAAAGAPVAKAGWRENTY